MFGMRSSVYRKRRVSVLNTDLEKDLAEYTDDQQLKTIQTCEVSSDIDHGAKTKY